MVDMLNFFLRVAFAALVGSLFFWRFQTVKERAEELETSLKNERAEYAATIEGQKAQIAALEKSARATAEALQIAAAETQDAQNEAAELRGKLRAAYENDSDSALWADTPIPDPVCRLLNGPGASRHGD